MYALQSPTKTRNDGNDSPEDTEIRSTGSASCGFYRMVLLCLGVMCFVQGTQNVVLRPLSNGIKDNSTVVTKKEDQLQDCFRNLTTEEEWSQTRFDQLQRELDQLQTRYNQLLIERDQSQAQLKSCEEKDSTCPVGWTALGSSIYYISKATNDWSHSRKDCQERGADLVVINSREEQDFIRSLMVPIWIGLIETDSVWTWVDGSSLSTRFWLDGEPNEYRYGEDCAQSKPNPESVKSWNDERCQKYLNWVCERRAC
ncbi:CD209 antigen-like protein E [Electrophorus electricus]|uniref:CD209 antigen-like protein E n=1 Tax=Electrophorus electricus TaxID=8005 RepID=UPI0015D035A9|nr:CD209 antigen-like protein E [Electrophorus electricus]